MSKSMTGFYNASTHDRVSPGGTTDRVYDSSGGGMLDGDLVGVGSPMVVWVKGANLVKAKLDAYWLLPNRYERLFAILSIILERIAAKHTKDGYCPISCRILESIVGREYSYTGITKLTECGILECDGHYWPNSRCMGYRFSPEIEACPAAPFFLSERFSAKILTRRFERSQSAVGSNLAHQSLWRSLQHLSLHPSWRSQLPPSSNNPEEQLRRDAWQLSGDYIERHHWLFSTDPKSGRVFNNITWLAKDIRRFALLDGCPCAEIDVSNSQPYFLSMLYPDRLSTEARDYAQVVSSGMFYETIGIEAGVPVDLPNRDKLKDGIFAEVLFGGPYPNSKLYPAFERRFPELASVVADFKASGKSALPIHLQKMEASVVIGKTVPLLNVSSSIGHLLTVHDSLIVPYYAVETAKDVFSNLLREATGIEAKLKVKHPPAELLPAWSESAA